MLSLTNEAVAVGRRVLEASNVAPTAYQPHGVVFIV